MSDFSLLLTGLGLVCLLVLEAPVAEAECCARSKVLQFHVTDGTCGAVGGTGYYNDNCTIEICADGEPFKGSYCGVGPCNIAGCGCDCKYGDWEMTFLDKAPKYNIIIIQETWKKLGIRGIVGRKK